MKREVTALLGSIGYGVEWRDRAASSEATSASLILLELRGSCQAPAHPSEIVPLTKAASLASSAVVDGAVLPFSWLDCNTLTRLLAPAFAKANNNKFDYLYGRAMGRLAAHELMHVLSGRVDHDDAGVGKPYFSAKDILSDHFAFENETIAALPVISSPTASTHAPSSTPSPAGQDGIVGRPESEEGSVAGR
jgi:hypothetical protein